MQIVLVDFIRLDRIVVAGYGKVGVLSTRKVNCRLKSYEQALPGNYPYEQTEGIRRKFKAVPTPESQAYLVYQFRKGNGLPRASIPEALEDVDRYQCQRLGNSRTYCTCSETAQPGVLALNASSPIISPCKGCGAPLPQ